ncbi:tandem-95 repeat protein, partial [Colwellia sp. BRX10-3]|uniref:tandem-95 repeat protein n=1 Tax=Colwellia sp. BRX10-3 TaxID=2759844 RepID=UPI0015F35992
EDEPLTITFASLLANDNDIDGDTLTLDTSAIPTATKGVLTLSGASFIYTPTANVNGTDTFTYKIDDGSGTLVDGTVNLTINAVNDAPVAGVDSYTFDEDVTLAKLVSDGDNLLGNDTDEENDTLTITLDTDAINGTLTLGSDGSFSYVPDANFNGADSFVYQVDDGNGGTDTATVNLTIQAVNDAPQASPQTFSVFENGNDGDVVGTVVVSDIEGDTLAFSLTAGDTGLFQIDAASGEITVKGSYPLDYETNIQHTVTVTIDDDGAPIAESKDVVITIDVTDIPGDAVLGETAGFGRAALGSLELTSIKTQPQLNKSVTVGSKVYFIGSIDNVDKDVYVVAYNDDSTLDATFGTNGKQTFDLGAEEYGKAIVEIEGNLYLVIDRDDGTYTEICFLKVDSTGNVVTAFADNGLRCTTEQKILTINDAVDIVVPAVQGNAATEIATIFAVGKVQGVTDDDLLVIRVDKGGNFQASTTFVNNVEVVYSPHIMLDITGLGLDDEGIAVYNPHNNEAMIAGNVLTADGDYDIFAWIFNPKNADGNYVKFNSSTPVTYDIGGIGADDKVGGIDGENTGAGEHTAHIAGSTVLASGEQDAFIFEVDSYAAPVAAFGSSGIAIFDVDGVASTGSSEFTGYEYDYSSGNLYLTGNLFDGKSKPFTTRVFAADGTVDSTNYGINGYKTFNYASGNAYALGMSLDSVQTMWIPGYAESGTDKIMTISSVDNIGVSNDIQFVNGQQTFTHSSTASDDIVAQVIQIQDLAQQGKFLVASTADNVSNKSIILTRFTSAGLLDTSFDTDGHKQLKIGTSAEVKGLFELADGKYIVYGNVTEAADNGFIARIDQNGVLDSAFATDGIYTTSALGATNIHFNQAKEDSAGNLVAVGNYDIGSKSAFVLRLTSAGVLDTIFNTQGYVVGANTDDYFAVEIDASNNIYAGGNRISGGQDMLLIKYIATDGAVDSTFNSNVGELVVDVAGGDNNVEFIGFDSSNNLYLVGNDLVTLSDDRVAVVKISSTGALDNSFSSNGKASFSMAPITADSGMTSAAIDTNDNIVVVGFSDALGSSRHMIGRITSTGTIDNSFDFNGYSRVNTCSNTAQLESLILLNNSSFIVAGQCYIDGTFGNNIDLSHYQLN